MNENDSFDPRPRGMHRRDFMKGAALTGSILLGGGMIAAAQSFSAAPVDAPVLE